VSPTSRRGPLAGIRVVVTRAEHQAGGLVAAFEAAGAHVEVLPLLEIVPPADRRSLEKALAEVSRYDWLVFTSANAVEGFLPAAIGGVPPGVRIAVVGHATADAVRARGIEPNRIAHRGDAEGLLEDLLSEVHRGTRVLLPQAADARPTLLVGLRRAGVDFEAVVAYDKRLPPDASRRAEELFGDSPLGWVTFTSPRIVRHFAELFGEDWDRRRPELRAVSIGPVTSAELRRLGVEPAAEAASPGNEEMVRAVAGAIATAASARVP
jgi:uroporphyrinogen-III synthase